jgi:hypothetical protein
MVILVVILLSVFLSHEAYSKEPATGSSAAQENSVVTEPSCVAELSSALHIWPPFGKDFGNLEKFDPTLLDFLTVSVCEVIADGSCVFVDEFTSCPRAHGQNCIRLTGHRYHLNWKPDNGKSKKKEPGREYEIRFMVAGLDLGSITYVANNHRAWPLMFRIDNHPIIRAGVMFEQGYTAAEVAEQLISEFGLGDKPECIAEILKYVGFGCTEIGEALADVFGFDAVETAQVLKDIGCSSTEVGIVLRDVYGLDADAAAEILNQVGFSFLEVGYALRDAFGLDALSAAWILKGLGAGERDITEMLMLVFDTFLAIVDVRVTDEYPPYPSMPAEYTGIAHRNSQQSYVCIQPFVPGLLGARVLPNDVNDDIGGTFTTIWVKYDLVEATSDTPVLTGMAVTHWPYWNVDCSGHGADWQPASGTSSHIPGALTTGTYGPCDRNGLCVKYSPMSQIDTFITDVGLSRTDEGESACPPLCEANLGYWYMEADDLDIHRGCGSDPRATSDDYWYVCYNRARPWPPMKTTIDVTAEEKYNFLEGYAPRVWLAQGEGYMPSSVEWAFQHVYRYLNGSAYWLHSKESMCDSDILWWFSGDLSTAPTYAFWVEKAMNVGGVSFEFADMVYFFYYPYNRGKEVVGTTYGHHVGDWEHVSVRLMQAYDEATEEWAIQPQQMYLSAHSFGKLHEWAPFPKVPSTTHPIVYSANGAHGLWPSAGSWHYETICAPDPGWGCIPIAELYDYTSEGTAWDTWEAIEAFDFNNQAPLGRYFSGEGYNDNVWPVWMREDFTTPCAVSGCDPADPASGPIYRWGNPECGEAFGECRLCDGPEGPVSKGVWDPGPLK